MRCRPGWSGLMWRPGHFRGRRAGAGAWPAGGAGGRVGGGV